MNITIHHDQSSIDPSNFAFDEDFEAVLIRYERAIVRKLMFIFPNAVIKFNDVFQDPDVEVEGSTNNEDCVLIVVEAIEEVMAEGRFWH